jgi:C4-dicarboxylate-specific signal transduction histidine kinase
VKLRWKTFTIISVAVVSPIGILFVVTRTIMMESVTEMEQKTTSQSINRVLSALSNELDALDATTQGRKLTISSKAAGGDTEFMLNDTGVGMAKEVSEKIWTPFFTTKAKGMGLGLTICRRIIEAHQGKISVDSIIGEGTTFTVTIPLEPKPKAEGGEKAWVNVPESLLSTTTKA